MNNRAYSLLTLKSVDDDKRIVEGIASTPTPDSYNDIVELDGMDITTPIPFLYQHQARQPIGSVISAKKTKDGLLIRAQIAGDIAPFITEAWSLIKAGLVRGLSIGFRAIEEAYNRETGGFHFIKTKIYEISAVTIPANQDCNIEAVKSYDSTVRAALGTRTGVVRLDSTVNLPGVSGRTGKTKMGKPISDQIKDFEAQVVANEARLNAIVEKSVEEGRTFTDAEKEEQSTLESDIKSVTEHIATLKKHEQRLINKATPITPEAGADPEKGSKAREGHTVTIKSNLPKGTMIARYAIALANAKGNHYAAADLAKEQYPDMPELNLVLRAAVAAGSSSVSGWASQLIPAAQQMQGEFIDLLRPQTIVGRIPGLRRVPFNITIPSQTGGGTYGWVGEGAAKPVTSLTFGSVTLRWAKIAGIIVITKELMRFSNPAAEAIIRDDMVQGTARYIDTQFVDPTVAEVTSGGVQVSPASITNGVTPTAASGTTAAAFRTDMKAVMGTFITASDDPMQTVVLMSSTVALNLSLLINTLGQPEFPNIGLGGGTILGLPVVISQNVGARIIVLRANEILLADDGPVEIDISEEASIVMDTLPQSSPAATSLVSLWQRNYLGLRVDKFITWAKARSTSVAYISNAAYGG